MIRVFSPSGAANVYDGVENDKSPPGSTAPAIMPSMQRQPGVNTIEVVDRIKKILPSSGAAARRDRPSVLYDRPSRSAPPLHEVQFTLVLASCLVILVIFLFLRNLSATLIPSLALPISIVGTFGLMFRSATASTISRCWR